MSNVAEHIALYQRKLEKYAKSRETDKLLYYIHKLKYLNVTVSHLEETGVGRSVNSLRHHEGLVGEKARALVNKWKVMVKAEEEEDDEEVEVDTNEEGEEKRNALPTYETEDDDNEDVNEDEEEDDHLQIDVDNADEILESEDAVDGYSNPECPTEEKREVVYGSCEAESDGEGYDPKTSQRDYLQHALGPSAPAEYVPSSSLGSPRSSSSPVEKDSSSIGSSDRKNGSSTKSSSKKSSREVGDRYKEKERHKDREKDCHKESSGGHDKERKKEHKEKHKDKHRDREEKRGEKDKGKIHKGKHRDKDKHNEKQKVSKHKYEEYSEKSKTDDEEGIVNGFSTPEVERRSVGVKHDSRESDKRNDEKRKEKTDKISSSHRKEESVGRDSVRRENKVIENSRERESSREKDGSKVKEKQKEEKPRDKHKDSSNNSSGSSSSNSKKEKHKKELDVKKNHVEQDDSESDRKESKKKKKIEADADAGFGAALMGLDSPVKRKKKKKKKDAEKEKDIEKDRESSDDEQPSTSKSSSKRLHSDGGGLPDTKKPKLLLETPSKLPSLPALGASFMADDSPLLPEINPNYKPLPRVPIRDDPADYITSKMSEEEALNIMLQSKSNRRSKVYSGKVSGLSFVPTLYEACIRVLQENIDALEFTGGIPFEILRPVLERASPQQLLNLEDFNSYLLEDTNVLWEVHCKRDFRKMKLEEMETWREMWIRCFEERERKLRSLTQNLQQKFVSKAEPKRTTKLAFVDSAVKVPKSVARAQAKFGTAAPSATAAKPGKANEVAARKTAMQNVQRAERAANTPRPVSAKNKKVAPLMAKTRQFFKKAFRR
ncbi:transcription elongation factor B polypeptide 3 [Procambarus clarkii]|uniref:transcription elongation factor B polypeptide 3 n=1 Tax=Procambarus clarkii TaxID=6728 RepID=UPI001E670AAB|nr:transcription elongation factor B polypeptide 3-like isoform X1 [Procambarus clarkii]